MCAVTHQFQYFFKGELSDYQKMLIEKNRGYHACRLHHSWPSHIVGHAIASARGARLQEFCEDMQYLRWHIPDLIARRGTVRDDIIVWINHPDQFLDLLFQRAYDRATRQGGWERYSRAVIRDPELNENIRPQFSVTVLIYGIGVQGRHFRQGNLRVLFRTRA